MLPHKRLLSGALLLALLLIAIPHQCASAAERRLNPYAINIPDGFLLCEPSGDGSYVFTNDDSYIVAMLANTDGMDDVEAVDTYSAGIIDLMGGLYVSHRDSCIGNGKHAVRIEHRLEENGNSHSASSVVCAQDGILLFLSYVHYTADAEDLAEEMDEIVATIRSSEYFTQYIFGTIEQNIPSNFVLWSSLSNDFAIFGSIDTNELITVHVYELSESLPNNSLSDVLKGYIRDAIAGQEESEITTCYDADSKWEAAVIAKYLRSDREMIIGAWSDGETVLVTEYLGHNTTEANEYYFTTEILHGIHFGY